MTSPWNGPRHLSWASNTVLTFIMLLVTGAATVTTDLIGEPPTYLVALLGASATAFFTALSTDKQKSDDARDAAVGRTEAKVDAVTAVAAEAQPGFADQVADRVKHQNDDKSGNGGDPT